MFRSCFGGQTKPQKNHSNDHRKTKPHDLRESLIPSNKSQGSLDTDNRKPLRNSPHPNVLGDTTRPTHTPDTSGGLRCLDQAFLDIRTSQDLSGSNHGIETSRPLRLAPRTIDDLRKRFVWAAHSPACGTKFFTQSDPRNPGSETPPSQRSQTLDTGFTQTVLLHEIYVVEDSPPSSMPSSTENTGSEQHGEETESDTDLQFKFDDVTLRH
ncbi:MAG: hypothetical protein ISQ13_04860 [Candidatus Margulisbacteria bacterium]|nr:hypothetical protein [Candidatus Margulisiibacteriota bacterium]